MKLALQLTRQREVADFRPSGDVRTPPAVQFSDSAVHSSIRGAVLDQCERCSISGRRCASLAPRVARWPSPCDIKGRALAGLSGGPVVSVTDAGRHLVGILYEGTRALAMGRAVPWDALLATPLLTWRRDFSNT